MANSNDQRILELAGKAGARPAESLSPEAADYINAVANCAPDLVRRIAALREAINFTLDKNPAPVLTPDPLSALIDALDADDAARAAMKVGDE